TALGHAAEGGVAYRRAKRCEANREPPTAARRPTIRPPSGGVPASQVDLVGGRDQADVAERLREVAELLAVLGVDLLGQQAEIVRVAGELREQLLGTLDLAGLGEARDEPERADHERALLAHEAVGVQTLLVAVTEHEA